MKERLLKSKRFTRNKSIIIMKGASAITITQGTATLTQKRKIIILMITRDMVTRDMITRDMTTKVTDMEDAIMV
jgi:hypothetical protein